MKALVPSSANYQVNVMPLAYSLQVRSNMKNIDSSTRKRRIFLGSALSLLIVATTAIQIQNSELANALIPVAQTPIDPPIDIPAEIDPPAVDTPPTDPITQKLLPLDVCPKARTAFCYRWHIEALIHDRPFRAFLVTN